MNDVAGWVLVGIGVLLFAYIVPAAVRSRQLVVDSRVDDRFSSDLRIVATAGQREAAPASGTGRESGHPRLLQERHMTSRDLQLDAYSARRLAAIRAARAAASSRRAAAARRRLLITALLTVAAIGCWVGVALASWSVVAASLVTAALMGVVVLGQRAAVAGRQAEGRWAVEVNEAIAAARTRTEDRSQRGSALRMDVDPAALITAPIPEATTEAESSSDSAWTPVPVPPPAYTLKPAAPRRQVQVASSEADTQTLEPVVEAGPQTTPESVEREDINDVDSAIDVQEVLARRRRVS
ncbi:MAG: hypothetical protein ACK5KU_08795 [Beutenbergiaceae bacterium]